MRMWNLTWGYGIISSLTVRKRKKCIKDFRIKLFCTFCLCNELCYILCSFVYLIIFLIVDRFIISLSVSKPNNSCSKSVKSVRV